MERQGRRWCGKTGNDVAERCEGKRGERTVAIKQERPRQQDEAKANRRKAGVQGKRWCGRTGMA